LLQFVQTVSSFYFERAKMDLYFAPKASARRRAVQSTCHYLLVTLVRYLSPCLSFMTEEVFLEYDEVLQRNASKSSNESNSNDCDVKSKEAKPSVHLQSFASLVSFTWSDLLRTLQSRETSLDGNQREKEECAEKQSTHVQAESFETWTVAGLQGLWKELMALRKRVNVVLERGRKEV
jgi:isoleucyl-tRNA synthetase